MFISKLCSLPSPRCASPSFLQTIDRKMCSYLALFPYLLHIVEVCLFSRQLIGRCVQTYAYFFTFSALWNSVYSPDDHLEDVFILSPIPLPSPRCGSLSILQTIDRKMCSYLASPQEVSISCSFSVVAIPVTRSMPFTFMEEGGGRRRSVYKII